MTDLDENVLVMNGDICTNMPFDKVYQAHVAKGALATVSTYRRREQIELGVLDVDEPEQRVIGFREKPVYDFFVSMGVNVFPARCSGSSPRGSSSGSTC